MTVQSPLLAQARARHALRTSGLPHDGKLVRASSTRNEIYLTERFVVRVNSQIDQRLRRESAIYDYLPPRPWAPQRIATGGELGADFLIVARRPGVPLAHSWHLMSPQQRRRAINQLADAMRAVHTVPTPPADIVAPLHNAPQLVGPSGPHPTMRLLAGLHQLARDPNADRGVIDASIEFVESHAYAVADYHESTLIHGDLTFENVLWDGAEISAVVDFEWCRGAPADLDLDVLLRCFALPEAHAAPNAANIHREDYADASQWLAEDYPELFSHPHLHSRLLLYSMAYDVADAVQTPIPSDRRRAHELHPYNRLISLLAGGSYLHDFVTRMGSRV